MPARKPSGGEPTVELSWGQSVSLDGDIVFLIDTLYREFAAKHGFAPEYTDLQREILHVLEQMSPAHLREYLASSLFLNYVTYENEMAEKLTAELLQRRKRRSAT